ncbi:hypothetical protein BHM03_00049306 [Ensete ventricosum]|nr:hypothetical protein BHM03_00049306 [Ensete ventricosum]
MTNYGRKWRVRDGKRTARQRPEMAAPHRTALHCSAGDEAAPASGAVVHTSSARGMADRKRRSMQTNRSTKCACTPTPRRRISIRGMPCRSSDPVTGVRGDTVISALPP